jgi:endonuclease/exonuclease/phosphatase family metal-dependent hydrolase
MSSVFLRKPERPFHIDFCFVPQAWATAGLHAEIVSGPEWRLLSDHFPLVVATRS